MAPMYEWKIQGGIHKQELFKKTVVYNYSINHIIDRPY